MRIVDLGSDSPGVPGGKPIPGVTDADDVRFALDKARRFIFRGGDRTDPRFKAYVNTWLDYQNTLDVEKATGRAATRPASLTGPSPDASQATKGMDRSA